MTNNEITRTMKTMHGYALVFNKATNALEKDEFTFVGVLDEKATKGISKAYEKDDKVFIKCDDISTTEMVYAVDELVFIENAHVITSRNSAIRMVTRTIKATNCNVLVFNFKNNTLETLETVISGYLDDKARKALEKRYTNDTTKFIQVTPNGVEEKTLGMTETEFLKLAHPCDRRNK